MVFVVYFFGSENGIEGVYELEEDAQFAIIDLLIVDMVKYWKETNEEPYTKLKKLICKFQTNEELSQEEFVDLLNELMDCSAHCELSRHYEISEETIIKRAHIILDEHFTHK